MSTNYYPRFKNILGPVLTGIILCLSLASMAQPVVSTVTPGFGIGGATSVTITGSGFDATAANDVVFFGATKANVLTASTSSLTVTVPIGAIYAPVTVLNLTTHLTGFQHYQYMPSYDTSCFRTNQITFQPSVAFTADIGPITINLADVDGDGKADMVVGEWLSTDKVLIYRNTSTAGVINSSSFAAPVTVTTTTLVLNVKVADLDGDGKPELIYTGPNTARVYVVKNNSTPGAISFAAPVFYITAPGPIETAIGDYDGDGKPDMAVVCDYDSVCLFRNLITTPGTFVTASFQSRVDLYTGSLPKSIFAIDFDGDSKCDLVTSNSGASTVSLFRNTSTAGAFSTSTFANKVDFAVGARPQEVQAGDLDGDGKPEIITADSTGNAISILYNTASVGAFTASSFGTHVEFSSGSTTVALTMGDVNGDHKLDILAANSGGGISVFRNITIGTGAITSASFAPYLSLADAFAPVGIALGDVDGDTRPDLVVSNVGTGATPSNVFVFRNNPQPVIDTIVGTNFVCAGSTSPYTNTVTGGFWTVTNHTSSSISTSGILTGGTTSGVDTITYMLVCSGDTARTSKAVTIYALPVVGAITGPTAVCLGDSILLSDTSVTGSWAINSTPTLASISQTGYVTGLSAGTAAITYARATDCGLVSTYYSVTVNALPAHVSGPSYVCVGSNATLSDVASPGTWSIVSGPASIGSSSGVVHGNSAGTSVIDYTATSTGCHILDTIAVSSVPQAISGDTTICVGITTTLSDPTSGSFWYSSFPGIATVDSNSGIVLGLSGGSTTISYGAPGSTCAATITVHVNPIQPPLVSISSNPSTAICAGASVTYTANPIGGGASPSYVWRVNGIPMSTANHITIAPGSGDVVFVKMYSSSACVNPDTATASLTVSISPTLVPVVTVHTLSGHDTVCSGAGTSLLATAVNGGTAPQFEWYVNNVPVGFGSTYGYVPANGDIVMVKMESNVNCPSNDTVSGTKLLHVVPYVTPTVSLAGSDVICEGYPAVIAAVSTYPGYVPIYEWTVNGLNTSTLSTLSYMPTTGDVVQVTMTSDYPCLSAPVAVSNTYTLTVVPVALPSLFVHASNTIVLPGMVMQDTFWAVPTNGGSAPTFQWYNDTTAIPGATDTRYITNAITAPRDSISCKMVNTDLCNDITVYDYIIVVTGLNVGVQQMNNDHSFVNILPNPNNGSFTVKGNLGINTDEEVTLTLTNMLGQVVHTQVIRASSGAIDEHLSLDNGLDAGMYMLNVQSDHMNKVIKFAIER